MMRNRVEGRRALINSVFVLAVAYAMILVFLSSCSLGRNVSNETVPGQFGNPQGSGENGEWSCPYEAQLEPDNDPYLTGAGYYEVCTQRVQGGGPTASVGASLRYTQWHGYAQLSDVVCAFPAYQDPNTLQVSMYSDPNTGVAYDCKQVVEQELYFEFNNYSQHNAFFAVEGPLLNQFLVCVLGPSGNGPPNYFACPFYSFGRVL